MAGLTPSSRQSSSSTPRPSLSSSLSGAGHPRSSSQARIEEILETGRRRSVQFARAGPYLSQNDPFEERDEESEAAAAKEQMSPPRLESLSPSALDAIDSGAGESSADEQTAIMRKRSRDRKTDYQGTAAGSLRATGTHSNASFDNRRSGSVMRGQSGVGADDQPAVDDDGEVEGTESWWKKQLEKYGSIELENKGSVARDHLALERTFLAWLRTSLAFASIGIAITQLFRLNTSISGSKGANDPYLHLRQLGKPLGATFLGVSILVLSIGFHRYFESQHWIIRGKFPASRGSVLIVVMVTLALMVTSLIVVVVVEPSAFEKRSQIL